MEIPKSFVILCRNKLNLDGYVLISKLYQNHFTGQFAEIWIWINLQNPSERQVSCNQLICNQFPNFPQKSIKSEKRSQNPHLNFPKRIHLNECNVRVNLSRTCNWRRTKWQAVYMVWIMTLQCSMSALCNGCHAASCHQPPSLISKLERR